MTTMTMTDQMQFLIYLTERGMRERYPESEWGRVAERNKTELSVIIKQGFSEYFLVLADIAKFCRENDIAMGPARGSAGGSVVAYCLYITNVEPLRHGLIFERFLSPERKALPDIDTDICWANRQRVIDYIVSKYGEDRVAQIVTFNTLQPKALLQDVGRVLQIPIKTVEELKSLIPEHEGNSVSELKDNEAFMKKLDSIAKSEPRLIPAMERLEGLHRNESLHSGGIIIARDPITTFMPTFRKSGKGRLAVQYEMFDAEAVGGLKMDILGLKTVTMIDWAEKDVRDTARRMGNVITGGLLQAMDLADFRTHGYREDDQEAFDIINRGDTAGIFQLEGAGITKFAMEMKVESFNDIVALLALYRPGPLDSGMAYDYIKRKNGQAPVSYPHPDLEWVLRDTYGIITYQEQVMQILGVMAGYSMGKADTMRKAMGKKDADLMKSELTKFKQAALDRGYMQEKVDEIADLIETFARYGFNKSHAVAYAYLCYWSAVIKARFPAAFFAAWLNVTEDMARQGWILDQAVRRDIKILPPDVNRSGRMFTMLDPQTILFGIQAVRGMGESFVEKLIKSREADGPFDSFHGFCSRLTSIPIDKKEALIKAGSFDFTIDQYPMCTRAFLIEHARAINELAKKKSAFSYDNFRPVAELEPLKLAELEKETLSFYVTINPIALVQDELRMMGVDVGASPESLVGSPLIGGRVGRVSTLTTKRGQEMAFVTIDDGIQQYDITVFSDVWVSTKILLKADSIVLIRINCDMYKGKRSLVAKSVEPLDVSSRRTNLVIDMGTNTGPLDLAQLYSVLDAAPSGRSSVDIWVQTGNHRIRLRSNKLKIAVTDQILIQIKTLFGPLSVSLRPEV